MKFAIDCEFNGQGGQLLSLALVPFDKEAAPFYNELVVFEPMDPWVQEHVMPYMKFADISPDRLNRLHFQFALENYLSIYTNVEILADCNNDIKYFCDILTFTPGQMLNVPDLSFKIIRVNDAEMTRAEVPHNALSDALALRDHFLLLENY